eukprot:Em0005g1059a
MATSRVYLASQNGHYDVVKTLLASGADVNIMCASNDYNYSGDSSLESDEYDQVIEVHSTQTVECIINLVENVSAPLQIPGTMEATPAKQPRKRKLKTQQSRAKGLKKIIKITPAERAYEFKDHGLIVSNAELFCDPCHHRFDSTKKSDVTQHIKSKKHEMNIQLRKEEKRRQADVAILMQHPKLQNAKLKSVLEDCHLSISCHAGAAKFSFLSTSQFAYSQEQTLEDSAELLVMLTFNEASRNSLPDEIYVDVESRGWKNLKEEANLKMDENDAGAISLRKSNKNIQQSCTAGIS